MNYKQQEFIIPGFVPSPISYYDQSIIPLKIETDPYCSIKVGSLFVFFAGDYFHSQNISQKPEFPGRESAWSKFVRAFTDQPAAVNFIRNLSRLIREEAELLSLEYNQGQELIAKMNSFSALTKDPLLDVPAGIDAGILYQDIPIQDISTYDPVNNEPDTNKKTTRPDRACEHQNCPKEGGFNFPGETKRRFCKQHKLKGMVSVIKCRKCEHPNCKKRPFYNYDGETIFRFCGEHKLEGMFNIKSKTCISPGCKKRANFNFPGFHKREYCGKHKLDGMMQLGMGKCERSNCLKAPKFNF